MLTADDEAEHIPGCNMAFRRDALIEVGGFDPVFVTAGDDVDLCWRVLDRGWKIGFHPAALVWHHRRGGLRAYLRQQRGYGRSEALVEARHPNRFSSVGSARWKGRIYQPAAGRASRQRIYRGDYGTAAYQSVYQGGGYFVDLLHQVGVPLLVVLALTAPLAFVSAWMGLPAAAAVSSLAALVLVDTCRATSSRVARTRPWLFGLRVAIHQVLQPLVRTWTRARTRHQALRTLPAHEPMPPAVRTAARGVVVFRHDGSRAGFAARLAGHLRGLGIRSMALSGWEDHDGRFVLSPLVFGDLVTSSHPVGFVQARIRPRLRTARLLLLIGLGALALVANELMAPVVLVFVSSALGHGVVRSKTLLRSAMDRSH